ncbi:general transcription factor IIE subunit 1 [Contarinia nasturtii]|uniref:general transcription factor IIE subunit 1 n=1 Tax=Contarinia nasturtii TaxID=265458 RepID=UPI0012D47A9E|nr:general transcription factor IIE subunit 1 [Contarinia nasturtii]XP_031623563.1 general transcription factor IIE subunit 1 [Contarinia nasturtii]XP_031623564.1 general transcription factor IIE subunit 1 [Contarinia nasturtii]
MGDQVLVTEIPSSLKQLARFVVRGFYTIEDALIIDMLVRNPCMKEDDICELLNFDRKQLRARITVLKNDKILQGRLKMETGPDGKAAKVTYHFINYKTLVNVVKYKFDWMNKRINTSERDATSRASFKCINCQKTFTDLDAADLFDPMENEFRCTYCSSLVEEDKSALPQKDSRFLLAKFNDQMQIYYDLLKAVENIKLSPECLEPEPIDIETIRGTNKALNRGGTNNGGEQWSGEATRNQGFAVEETRVDVTIGDANPTEAVKTKERPIWMTESTIVSNENTNDTLDTSSQQAAQPIASRSRKENEDIMSVLLQHEKQPGKANTQDAAVRSLATSTNNSDSSDDEQEIENAQIPDIDVMDTDSDGDETTVLVAGKPMPLDEVIDNEEIIAQMTPQEKDAFIQVWQETYSHMHD